jgi:hypothetical protein
MTCFLRINQNGGVRNETHHRQCFASHRSFDYRYNRNTTRYNGCGIRRR